MTPTEDPVRPPPAGTRPKWTDAEWTAFFAENAKQLRSLVARKSNLQTSDQDDAYGEAMLGVSHALARGEQPRKPFSFVSRIALLKAISKVREVARARRRPDEPLRADTADPARHGLDAIEAEERREAVDAYLKSIDPTDRAILVARGVEEQTWEEVSALVGIPKSTVVRRYAAARDHARRQLAAWAP